LLSPQELRKYYEGYGTTKTPYDQVEFLIDKSVAYFEGFFVVTGFDRRNTPTSTFLEVGFGNGASLMAAAKLGFKAYGLDMDAECTRRVQEIACRHGQTVHSTIGEISSLDTWLKFDVIKASQVIEHTLDPLEFLVGLSKHQSAGGYLLLECPNNEATFWLVKNLLRRRFGRMNFYKSLKVSEHLYGFSKTSLARLLETVGYRIILCADYPLRDPMFHHENLLWYPTLAGGLRTFIKDRLTYPFLKSLIPPFDQLASKLAGAGTHMAVWGVKQD